MNRAVIVLFSLLPIPSFAHAEQKLPIQPPRWALLSLSEGDKITAEIFVGSRPEVVRQEVEIKIPYRKVGPDGSKIVAFKTQTKMKDIRVEQAITEKVAWASSDVVFLEPSGKRYQFDEGIKERLSKPIPVLLLTKAERSPFYEAILKPDTIIVVVPAQSLPTKE